jgi:3D (Asp-Asp-Asp) domain-containing protein
MKKLRDRSWSIPSLELDDGLTITNATFKVINVNYSVIQRIANVVVEFKENTFPIVREYIYPLADDSVEEISASSIQLFIKTIFPTADEIL